MKKSICNQFNELKFHDSKLIGFSLIRKNDELDNLSLDLSYLTDSRPGFYKYSNAKLIFEDCRIIRMDLDLVDKRYCSDDISETSCKLDSELKKELIEKSGYTDDQLEDYLHFKIELIPTGGDIDVLATNYIFMLDE